MVRAAQASVEEEEQWMLIGGAASQFTSILLTPILLLLRRLRPQLWLLWLRMMLWLLNAHRAMTCPLAVSAIVAFAVAVGWSLFPPACVPTGHSRITA